jgi:hypothetical protein
VNRQSLGLRRWMSNASKASHPFGDKSDITQSTCSDITTVSNGYTTFLPELYSTPPMPSFQKPHPGGALSTRNAADTSSFPGQNRVSGRTETLGLAENTMPTQAHAKVTAQSPVHKKTTLGQDVSSLLSSTTTRVRTRVAPFPPQDYHDRPIPPLPSNWTPQHDKAICILDVKNYSLPAMIAKLRRTFPSLCGPLTPIMIDKRLQRLDQNVELDYYSAGLRKDSRVVRAKLPLPPLPPPPLIPRRSWLRGGQDGGVQGLPPIRKSDETVRLAEVGPPVLKVRLIVSTFMIKLTTELCIILPFPSLTRTTLSFAGHDLQRQPGTTTYLAIVGAAAQSWKHAREHASQH